MTPSVRGGGLLQPKGSKRKYKFKCYCAAILKFFHPERQKKVFNSERQKHSVFTVKCFVFFFSWINVNTCENALICSNFYETWHTKKHQEASKQGKHQILSGHCGKHP